MFYSQKILTANTLKLLRGIDGNTFKKRLSYQLKTNKLIKIRKGIYVVADQLYQLGLKEHRIIANSIYIPSYLSFETALRDEGVIFQLYTSIFVASNYTKTIDITIHTDLDPIRIQYLNMPTELLTNPLGIKVKDGYSIATLERALCDTFWKHKRLDLDNLNKEMIRLPRLIEIAELYNIYKSGFKDDLFAKLKPYDIPTTV